MDRSTKHAVLLLLLVSAGRDLHAARQDSQPSSVLVRVLDAKGEPRAGAQVVYWHRPHAGFVALGPEENGEGRTDERGRLRVACSPRLPCDAQATWSDDDGVLHATKVVTLSSAERVMTLQEGLVSPPLELRFEGNGAALGRRGDLRLELWSTTGKSRRLFATTCKDAEPVAVPALPIGAGDRLTARVLDEDGDLVVASLALHGEGSGPLRSSIALDPERTIPLVARDPEGQPVPGVEVFGALFEHGYHPVAWRRLGSTDKAGRFDSPLLPSRISRAGIGILSLRKAGCQEALVQLAGATANVNGRKSDAFAADVPLSVPMLEARPFEVVVIGRDGKRVPQLAIEVRRQGWLESHGEGSRASFFLGAEVHRSDAEGRLVLPYLPSNTHDLEFLAHIGPSQWRAFEHASESIVALGEKRDRKDGDGFDAVRYDAREVKVERVEARDADGMPVSGVRFVFATDTRALPVSTRTDQRGRAALVRPESAVLLAAWHAEKGYAFQRLEPGERAADEPLVLNLRSFTERTVHVSKGGVALAGCGFKSFGWTCSGSFEAREHAIVVIVAAMIEQGLSDEDGSATLRFIPSPSLSIMLSAMAEGAVQLAGQCDFPLVENKSVFEFAVR